MFDLSGQQVLLRIVALLVIAATHGAFVAGLAILMGDRGPRYDGRLSLNPGKHIDFVGAVAMTLFRVGWIKPVSIELSELRSRVGGVVVIVLGSLLLTILLAELLALLRPVLITALPDTSLVRSIGLGIDTLTTMSIAFAIINLIPIPPFTGGLFLALVQPSLHKTLTERRFIVSVAIGAVVVAAAAADLISPIVESLRSALLP